MPDKPPYRLFQPWNRTPELEHLTEINRYIVWERANAASRFGCLATVACFAWIFFLLAFMAPLFYQFKELLLLATIIFAPLVIYQINLRVGRRRVQRWLVEVAYQRATACIDCGYSLIGTPIDSTQCPECGAGIPEGKDHKADQPD